MSFDIGSNVFLNSSLPYLKSNDPMPMLRPPDLVAIDEIGVVVGFKGLDDVEVRFRRGTFLIPREKLSENISSSEK